MQAAIIAKLAEKGEGNAEKKNMPSSSSSSTTSNKSKVKKSEETTPIANVRSITSFFKKATQTMETTTSSSTATDLKKEEQDITSASSIQEVGFASLNKQEEVELVSLNKQEAAPLLNSTVVEGKQKVEEEPPPAKQEEVVVVVEEATTTVMIEEQPTVSSVSTNEGEKKNPATKKAKDFPADKIPLLEECIVNAGALGIEKIRDTFFERCGGGASKDIPKALCERVIKEIGVKTKLSPKDKAVWHLRRNVPEESKTSDAPESTQPINEEVRAFLAWVESQTEKYTAELQNCLAVDWAREEAVSKWVEAEGRLKMEVSPTPACTEMILRFILGTRLSREEAVAALLLEIGKRDKQSEFNIASDLDRLVGLVGDFKKLAAPSFPGCWFEASWVKTEAPLQWRERREEAMLLDRAIKALVEASKKAKKGGDLIALKQEVARAGDRLGQERMKREGGKAKRPEEDRSQTKLSFSRVEKKKEDEPPLDDGGRVRVETERAEALLAWRARLASAKERRLNAFEKKAGADGERGKKAHAVLRQRRLKLIYLAGEFGAERKPFFSTVRRVRERPAHGRTFVKLASVDYEAESDLGEDLEDVDEEEEEEDDLDYSDGWLMRDDEVHFRDEDGTIKQKKLASAPPCSSSPEKQFVAGVFFLGEEAKDERGEFQIGAIAFSNAGWTEQTREKHFAVVNDSMKEPNKLPTRAETKKGLSREEMRKVLTVVEGSSCTKEELIRKIHDELGAAVVSKTQIAKKLLEIAVKEARGDAKHARWFVRDAGLLQEYSIPRAEIAESSAAGLATPVKREKKEMSDVCLKILLARVEGAEASKPALKETIYDACKAQFPDDHPSKNQIESKLDEVCVKQTRGVETKARWFVKDEELLTRLDVPKAVVTMPELSALEKQQIAALVDVKFTDVADEHKQRLREEEEARAVQVKLNDFLERKKKKRLAAEAKAAEKKAKQA